MSCFVSCADWCEDTCQAVTDTYLLCTPIIIVCCAFVYVAVDIPGTKQGLVDSEVDHNLPARSLSPEDTHLLSPHQAESV